MKKLLVLATTALISLPAMAETAPAAGYSDYLTVGVGQFDLIANDAESTAFSLEYKFKPIAWNVMRPIIGGFANTDGGVYGYGGFAFDFSVADNWVITPTIAVGAYDDNDNESKDLGGALEFRESIEIAYQCDSGHRIGLSLSHLSNAGLHDNNPGTELLMLNYGIPLSW